LGVGEPFSPPLACTVLNDEITTYRLSRDLLIALLVHYVVARMVRDIDEQVCLGHVKGTAVMTFVGVSYRIRSKLKQKREEY
jgi:hypothetical protein